MEERTEQRIIGGMFGLADIAACRACPPPYLTGPALFLANARSGIALLTQRLAPVQVWLPSYLCGVIPAAIRRDSTTTRFYEVNGDLVQPSLAWLDEVRPGDLVILVDYFGFPCDTRCAKEAKRLGAWILEDAVQALLSQEVGRFADFVLFSPRKYVGVPDGGILLLNRELDWSGLEPLASPAEWWLRALQATVLRREFDRHGGNREWFEMFQHVEYEGPIGYYAMSELSRTLLLNSFDYEAIAQRRRDNYGYLCQVLPEIALFPLLSSTVVPLGFPIRLRNRDAVRQVLFDHQIYPPIHWPIENLVPARFYASHRLAGEIMTLPCDQRYGQSDMERMADLVRMELKC